MRKPRDFDSELKALTDKARWLKERKLHQLGELVVACGADTLSLEQLAGALLAAAEAEAPIQEGWRRRGAAFFQRRPHRPSAGDAGDTDSPGAGDGRAPSL